MILEEKTKILIRKSNKEYYLQKNYDCKEDYLFVNNKDLPETSYYKIKVSCDKCNTEGKTSCRYYYKNLNNNGVYTCKDCNYKDRAKKSDKTKSNIGPDGLSIRDKSEIKRNKTIRKKGGYKKIIEKSVRARKKRDKKGLNSYERVARSKKFKDKRRKTCEDKKIWIPKKDVRDFKLYKREVVKITEKQNLKELDDINLRGRKYHLDHIFSVFEGYKRNICPFIIGNICNLQILSNSDNTKKGYNCGISEEKLFKLFESE